MEEQLTWKSIVDKGEDVRAQKHYTQFKIQPMEFIGLNNIGFLEGNIIKYVCRYKAKNGTHDLAKARFYLDKLIELESQGKITLPKGDE